MKDKRWKIEAKLISGEPKTLNFEPPGLSEQYPDGSTRWSDGLMKIAIIIFLIWILTK